MSQLDLEQLELEGEEHLAENQPAPGKATLTSRIGKPHRAGAGDLIDGATAAQLAGGLGVELSRGDGGDGGGGAPGVRKGLGLGFLGGRGAEMGGDVAGEELEAKAAGRGLEYLGGTSLAAQQREVVDFDRGAGDSFYDARATVDAKLTGELKVDAKAKKQGDEEKEGDEDEAEETPGGKPAVKPSARLEAQVRAPMTPGASGPGVDLRAQQRAVVDFDAAAGDTFYDARATVDAKLTGDARIGKKRDEEKEGAEGEAEETPGVKANARLEAQVRAPMTPGASGPGVELRAQQRAVVDFDAAAGDSFYDARATVDPTIAKAPPPALPVPSVPDLARAPGGPAGSVPLPYPNVAATPQTDLKSQQREVVNFDAAAGDSFYDTRATVDPTIAKTPPPAPPAPTLPTTEAASAADPAADEAKTKALTDAEK
ncbi:MAG: hypothetical protein K8M05_13530, partial [Deltaproteobacteria bacterium]|nr:hypothetical protein [Kofleriaceae bacterium]